MRNDLALALAVTACLFSAAGNGETANRDQGARSTAANMTVALAVKGNPAASIRPVALAAEPAALPSPDEVRIFVSTQGNDDWTGSSATASGSDGPVRSLHRAQLLARARAAAMATGQPRLPIRVLVQGGTYYLDSPLIFTPADSGTAQAPVSYEAITPGTVTVSGGVPLVLRKAATSSAPAVFELPAAARDTWRGGGQLFVNGLRATLARQPKAGNYWFVQRAVPLDTEAANEGGREAFGLSTEASTWLAKLSPDERARAIVQVMHVWNSSQHHIAGGATPGDVLRVSPKARWAFLSAGLSQRFFIENVPSALTAAGEWVATASEVRYRPTAAQSGKTLNAVLPLLEQLVVLRGDAAAGRWVQHLIFRGLDFAHTRYLTPDSGFSDPQAALNVGTAFEADGARGITIDQCSFSQTGGYGAWLRRSVRDSRISNSTFTDLGAGGIQLGVLRDMAGSPLATANNTIEGNSIGNNGAAFPGAVGIWLGQGFDNTITHNLVHDTSYTGISVGWIWGFGPSASARHRITDNLLVNIGGAQLSDMGGIYTLGTLTGTVISGNLIREVRAYPGYGPGPGLGAWGIYNDEGTNGVLVENNVVVGTDSGAYHLHFGRQITVRNNLLAGGTQGEIRLTRATGTGPQAVIESNIIIATTGKPLQGLASTAELTLTANQMATPMASVKPDLAGCGVGCTATSAALTIGADPKAIQFSGLDAATQARLAKVVSAAGPTATSAGGPTAAGPLKVQAAARQAAAIALAPPLAVTIDLRNTPIGSQPKGMNFSAASNTQAVHVVADAGAPDGRCLQFNDNPAFANRFDPHGFITLNHSQGTSTASFAILIDAKTDFVHEWRDNAQPYRIGPSLRITSAGVAVNGKVLAPVSVGQWARVKVTSSLGNPGARWQLDVQDAAGKTTTVAQLPPGSPAWSALHYAGYISNTAEVSSLCLGAIGISNTTSQ